MKKIVSILLALTLLCGMCLTLASCAKTLSGTYVNGDVSYTFKGNNFEKKRPSLWGGTTVYTGTYEINEKEDGTYTITLNYGEDAEEEDDGIELSFAEITVNDKKAIKIGPITYTKQ